MANKSLTQSFSSNSVSQSTALRLWSEIKTVNYRTELLSQLYVNLCDLVEKYGEDVDFEKLVFIYDDGCHFDAYKSNPTRANLKRGVTDIIAKMRVFIDKYHQSNHTACGLKYCIKSCTEILYDWVKQIKTEVCEETFSWFRKYKYSTTQMTGHQFKITILFLLCQFNERKIAKRRKQTQLKRNEEHKED
eukprot:402742_1